jgi:hypothetical protein
MPSLSCPNCAALVDVDQRFSHMAVCKSCRSVITFGEGAAELKGELSLLPPSRSQLFVGGQGKVDDLEFVVLGRVRYGYERGYWDEWYLQRGDGSTAWITEDPEGLVYESLVDENNQALTYEPMEPGRAVDIEGATFTVRERDVAHCQGGDGQLPFVVVQDEKTPFVDLGGPEDSCGSVEFGTEGTRVFVGRRVTQADLNLTVTRQEVGLEDIPLASKSVGGQAQLSILAGKHRAVNCSNCGGGMEVGVENGVPAHVKCPYCGSVEDLQAKEIACPTCAATIPLKSGSEAASVTCGECWTSVNLRSDVPSVLRQVKKPDDLTSPIALGSIFSWEETDYEVTGWIRNLGQDDGETFHWDEFLLFSEKGGYMWLELSDGHVSLGRRINDGPSFGSPGEAGSSIDYDGSNFRVVEVGRGVIHWVEGELPWIAQKGDSFVYLDAAKAPYRLGGEWTEHETEWFISEYLTREEVTKCLSTTPTLGIKEGVPAHQPYSRGATQVAVMSFIFLLLGLGGLLLEQGADRTATNTWSFPASSGVYEASGSQTKEFEVPSAGDYEVVVKAEKLNEAWAHVKGDFLAEGKASAAFSSQLGVYPDLSAKHRASTTASQAFTVRFKASGKHTLRIKADAASVFTGGASGVTFNRHSGKRCKNAKKGDRVIYKTPHSTVWELGRIESMDLIQTTIRPDAGKNVKAYANEYRCIDPASVRKVRSARTFPKIEVSLYSSSPFLEGFGLLSGLAGIVFMLLLFHRWGFASRQPSGVSWSSGEQGDD